MDGGMSRDVGIARFVERQMRNWELSRQQAPAEPEAQAPTVKFYVTISREMGCRGEAIADGLAARLGWQKFDREILEYMAGQADVRRRLFGTLDERHRDWMEGMLQPLIADGAGGVSDYFRALTRAILTICYYQHAIIVGRGANFVLPPDRGLRVRLVAPQDYRIATTARMEGIEIKQAKRRVEQVEAQRAKFTAGRFGRFPYDPRHYDLVVNTASFDDGQICELVIDSARTKAGANRIDL
jgi:cytidylate kinase